MSRLQMPTFAEVLAVSRSRGRTSDDPGKWNGLVAYYTALQGGGKQWFDVSGYDKHGTLTNMDPATDWVVSGNPRMPGYALDFDVGPSEHVEVPNMIATGDYSITAWLLANSLNPTGGNATAICDNSVAGGSGFRFFVFHVGGGVHRLKLINDSAFASSGATGATQFPVGSWVFCVGTSHNTGVNALTNVFLNGEFDGTAGATADYVQNASSIGIGDHATASGSSIRAWDGLIGFVSIYNRALLPSEIQQLYQDPQAMLRPRSRVYPAAVAAPPSFVPYPYPLHNLTGGLAT